MFNVLVSRKIVKVVMVDYGGGLRWWLNNVNSGRKEGEKIKVEEEKECGLA